jgi:hypothetical protein
VNGLFIKKNKLEPRLEPGWNRLEPAGTGWNRLEPAGTKKT